MILKQVITILKCTNYVKTIQFYSFVIEISIKAISNAQDNNNSLHFLIGLFTIIFKNIERNWLMWMSNLLNWTFLNGDNKCNWVT